MSEELPSWARGIVDRELRGHDLASFQVLKETPLEKLGVGYTPRDTFLIRKSLTNEEIFRLDRPADVLGERGERVGCPTCGAVFRVWREGQQEADTFCFECGERLADHAPPVGEMTPYEHQLETPDSHREGHWPGVAPGTLAAATRSREGTPIPPLGSAPDLRDLPHPGEDVASRVRREDIGARGAAPRPTDEAPGEAAIQKPYLPRGRESEHAPDLTVPFRDRGHEARKGAPAPERAPAHAPDHPLLTRAEPDAPPREPVYGHPAASVEASELLEIEGIGPVILHRLDDLGLSTFRGLAEADPSDVSQACEVPLATAKGWQAEADLLRLSTLGPEEAHALVSNGVDGIADLARRKPGSLAQVLRERGMPVNEDAVTRWITEARVRRDLPPR